ncbi:MAG: efflux RND transporter periplasmic adaptor subunit [Clostridiaceae bacterium]|jgi:RND family efflux transporter MFP subunit|nr:efflux RND transporter periplasmic adaptor subunit [Clostridiaceae bacterium]
MLYKKGFGYRLILSLILLVLIPFFSACSKTKQYHEEKKQSIPVIIMPVQKGSIENIMQYTGIVQPKKIVYVVSPISGMVSKAYFGVGDRVKSGETLFSVDSKELEANIKLLEEQLKVARESILLAKTAFSSAKGSGYKSQKLQLESALTSAENNYTAAKTALDIATVLYETKSINSMKYYEIKNQFEQAKTALRTSDSAYNLFVYQLSEEAISSATHQLNQAIASYDAIKIQIETAKEMLKHTNVESPIDGVIVAKDVFEGSLISNTMVSYIVADTDTVQISISVTEHVINKMIEGSELKIEIPAVGAGVSSGKISSVSPVMDKTTFAYQVLIDVPNQNNHIRPGMTAKVDIITEKREAIITAPLNSILSDDNGKFVFTIEDNKAIKRFVDTGISNNDYIEITKGLEMGNYLVVKGQHFLKHNDPVTLSQEVSK